MERELYYVIYVPQADDKNRYVNEEGYLGSYRYAEKHKYPAEITLKHSQRYYPNAKWVGPCEEGVEP